MLTALPAGPDSPEALQLAQWVVRPTAFLQECEKQWGDPFTMRLGITPPFVMFSDPVAIEQIFALDPKETIVGAGNVALRQTLGANSLILLDGERHRQQRKLLTPPFHGERMRSYGQIIRGLAEQAMARWQAGKPFLVRPAMQRISLGVILQAVFGLKQGERLVQVSRLLAAMLDIGSSPLALGLNLLIREDLGPWSPQGQIKARLAAIDALLYAEIRERRANPAPGATDILSLLMAARDEQGQGMSDVELRDELMTLLVAGHETTATALSWALYWLHELPQVREKLLAELAALPDPDDLEALARLPYLGAICNETLRIHPVALLAFPRIPQKPVEIAGRSYPAGSLLTPCIWLTHHREDLYPEPDRFRPERFLERNYTPYEFLPFGGGNRRCIGLAFALYEMKIVLATILQRTLLRIAPGQTLKPVRRGVTLALPEGFCLIPVAERPSLHKQPVAK